MGINTLNESSLHSTLKKIYSLDEGSRTEVEDGGHIYDIIQKDGTIIEIQTKNLSKLAKKAFSVLKKGKKIKIVHPVAEETRIETYDKNGNLISRRKSPKKESVYSVFRELTGLYPLLLEENFSLELVFAKITEIRTQTENPVQSKNRRRRFRKSWLKTDKKLDSIERTQILKNKEDYIALIPDGIPEEFTVKDIAEKLKKIPEVKNKASNCASLLVWVLNRMELIEQTGNKNRARVYKIKKTVRQEPSSYCIKDYYQSSDISSSSRFSIS